LPTLLFSLAAAPAPLHAAPARLARAKLPPYGFAVRDVVQNAHHTRGITSVRRSVSRVRMLPDCAPKPPRNGSTLHAERRMVLLPCLCVKLGSADQPLRAFCGQHEQRSLTRHHFKGNSETKTDAVSVKAIANISAVWRTSGGKDTNSSPAHIATRTHPPTLYLLAALRPQHVPTHGNKAGWAFSGRA